MVKKDELDAPSPAEAHAFLLADNDRRVAAMAERTEGKVQLTGAFESMKATTYLKHLCMDAGVLDRAELDFEGQRSDALDKIEAEVAEHEEKMKSALAQARLMGQPPEGFAGPRIVRPGE